VTADPFELIVEDDHDPGHERELAAGLAAYNRSQAERSDQPRSGYTGDGARRRRAPAWSWAIVEAVDTGFVYFRQVSLCGW
jgi:hypothetical protein